MKLDSLPEELLIIIFKQLDLKSLCNIYDTGNQRLQDVICLQGVIKECRLSLSSMATAKSLKLDCFIGFSKHLLNLDLSAIQDLTKGALLPVMKKTKNLVYFNVAYTNITILDLLEIYELCPTIRNITITYQFFKPNAKNNHFPLEVLTKCQDVFKNFENVHFVGSKDNLLYSNLPLNILQKAKLNSLTYTIAQDKMFTYYLYVEKKPLTCNRFNLNILCWKSVDYFQIVQYPLPEVITDLSFEYEFIHISDCTIYISPVFEKYFKENFQNYSIFIKPRLCVSLAVKSNHNIMIWNKDTTNFNDAFFHELDSLIKPLQPCIVTYSSGMEPVILTNDWICVIHRLQYENKIKKSCDFEFKRMRTTPANVTLDYDDILEGKSNVKLTICFYDHIHCPVTFAKSNFLKQLTFLQLRGKVKYSHEFFNILFRCCENLITLDVDGYAISPCAPPISRSIPLSRTIKNLRILDKSIDMTTLFSSLSHCSKLENVIVIDSSLVTNEVPNVDALFKQCNNLYYLCIGETISETARIKKLSMLNKTKDKYMRNHLVIEIISNCKRPDYSYDPFVDVFKLSIQLV